MKYEDDSDINHSQSSWNILKETGKETGELDI